ncbi:MAG: redoxin domain-containing protein [Hamadaea sp.]|nr:redoxin domain-containing protein [Hamadaea sp.]
MKRAVLVLAAGATLAAGAGCGGETPAATGTPSSASTSVAAQSGPPSPAGSGSASAAAVPETLKFTATTVAGDRFDGAALAGKPVVFWFWAAWCPKCRAAADEVAAAQQAYAGRVQFVGVAGLRSGQQQMARFVADTGVQAFPHLSDDDGVVWKRFGVTTQEYYVMLDKTGKVVHQGAMSADELRDRLATLAA